jgi:hypothetical protein
MPGSTLVSKKTRPLRDYVPSRRAAPISEVDRTRERVAKQRFAAKKRAANERRNARRRAVRAEERRWCTEQQHRIALNRPLLAERAELMIEAMDANDRAQRLLDALGAPAPPPPEPRRQVPVRDVLAAVLSVLPAGYRRP